MSEIVYGVLTSGFLLSSCYLLTRCICYPSIIPKPYNKDEYYVITKKQYERLNNKQPTRDLVKPPEYTPKAPEQVKGVEEPTENSPIISV
jgi:hypothetical protein